MCKMSWPPVVRASSASTQASAPSGRPATVQRPALRGMSARVSESAVILEPHTERQELAQHRRVGFGWHGGLPADPIVNVVVARREDALVLVELLGVERLDMGARELAQENVVLLVAAIDAAIEQTLAPRLEIRLVAHVFPRSGRLRGRSI